MDKKSSLVSFRVSPDSWEQFKDWAKSRGNTASSELQIYIQSCIGGSIDITAPSVNTSLDSFERRLNHVETALEGIPDPSPLVELLRAEMSVNLESVAELRERVLALAGEVADLKKL